jgi:hypothetical protein
MTLSAFTRSARVAASLSATVAAIVVALAADPVCAQVKSESLGALDLWSTPGRATGLPADLWSGASPVLVRAILDQVGDRPVSPALMAMARRVLASGAAAPDGAGSDMALAGARARALLALGDPEAVAVILARTPRIEASETLSRAKAEVALLMGRDQEACDVGQALQENRDGLWWLKLRAYCSLVADQGGAAQVTVDLWRQSGGKDAAFERLMTVAATGVTGKSAPALDDALDLALSRRLGILDAAEPQLASASPAVIAALASDPKAPPGVRLEAAARALRLGVVPAEVVRELYAPPTPPPALAAVTDGPAPPTIAELAKNPTALAEARLTAMALRSADPVEREAAAVALLGRARYAGEFIGLARLIAPALPEIVRSGAPLHDPVLFAMAAAVAGDTATADAVRGKIEQDKAPGPGIPSIGAHDLALLDALIAEGSGRRAGPVLDRLAERGGVGDPKLRAKAQGAALLLAAAGQPLSPEAKAELAAFDVPPAKASPTRLTLLSADGAHRLRGETALLALAIAEQQPTGPSLADRAAIVQALHEAGLEDEARAVAIESLLVLIRS